VDVFRGHTLAAAVVAIAAVALAAVFVFARPGYQPDAEPEAPDDLPYTAVSYTVGDARRAFAAEDIELGPRSQLPVITSLGKEGDVLEVDVFGDPGQVKASGFHDYTFSGGRYVRFPRDCGSGGASAERWHGNVRVMVSCTAAGSAAADWIRRVERAFARL
jgi:hypothetical protein